MRGESPAHSDTACPHCHYDLTGVLDGLDDDAATLRCSECGQTVMRFELAVPNRPLPRWMFESPDANPLFSLIITWIRLFAPWRFWSWVAPARRPEKQRLLIFASLCLLIALAAAAILITRASSRIDFPPAAIAVWGLGIWLAPAVAILAMYPNTVNAWYAPREGILRPACYSLVFPATTIPMALAAALYADLAGHAIDELGLLAFALLAAFLLWQAYWYLVIRCYIRQYRPFLFFVHMNVMVAAVFTPFWTFVCGITAGLLVAFFYT